MLSTRMNKSDPLGPKLLPFTVTSLNSLHSSRTWVCYPILQMGKLGLQRLSAMFKGSQVVSGYLHL